MLRWFEHKQVYVPSRAMETCTLDWPCEDVDFDASDGCKLNGWFFPAVKNAPRRELVLLLMHGNAGNICTRLPFYEAWLSLGLNVFSFDYRGYGASAGVPSEQGTYDDALGAHAWLEKKGFLPRNVIALGKSLGGGIASELASRTNVGGLILQSTFTSIADAGAHLFPFLPVRWMNRIRYATIEKLPQIRVPVMIIHSRDDKVIPFQHAQRNYAAANDPKMFWEIRGGHTGVIETDRAHYLEGLKLFLNANFTAAE